MHGLQTITALAAACTLAAAHSIMTYPGWRGNNLMNNGTIGVDEAYTYPYGMQWIYPCGGLPQTKNRTKWPMGGGAVAFQPGWAAGHSTAFIYVNLGLGNIPLNYSLPMVPVFQVVGPTNEPYPGKGVCLTQIPLPANVTVQPGDNATIQLVEAAKHGAALFTCVDITFAHILDVPEVNETNCYNSSDLGFNLVFATLSLNAGARAYGMTPSGMTLISLVATTVLAGLFL